MNDRFLIIGVGNKFRGDDGAGVAVAEKIKEYEIGKFDVKLLSGEGTELMNAWKDYDNVIIIDAVKKDGSPGKIYEMNANDIVIESDFFNYSSHAFGLAEAINVSKVMNKLPKFLIVYGIEGIHFNHDTHMAPEVEEAANKTANIITERYGN